MVKLEACRKLGEGGCGVIYEVALIASPHIRYACKAEDQDGGREEEILKMEEKVMRKINESKTIHCPQWIESGKFDNYNYMVMTLLGPSVSDLRKVIPTQKFTLFTTVVVGVQALDSLKEVHLAGYIHRDVKPSNYAIGETGTSKEKLIYILDFGLARAFRRVTSDGRVVLRNPRKTVQFRGTTRYCSINAHSREEQGRQDDLWSLFYMLVEMLIGNLPWKNMTDHGATEREKVSREYELLEQCPKEFQYYTLHLKQLSYATTPDYNLLRNLFLQTFKKNNFTLEMKLDWEKAGKYGHLYCWNTSILPKVTSKDTTTITLEQLLQIPDKMEEINEDMAMQSMEKELYATNSSQDDTLDECVSAKEKTMTKGATERTSESLPKTPYTAKKQLSTKKYGATGGHQVKYKPKDSKLSYGKSGKGQANEDAGRKEGFKEQIQVRKEGQH